MRQRLARFLGMTFCLELLSLTQPFLEFSALGNNPRYHSGLRGCLGGVALVGGSAALAHIASSREMEACLLASRKECRQPALLRRAESMTPSTQFPLTGRRIFVAGAAPAVHSCNPESITRRGLANRRSGDIMISLWKAYHGSAGGSKPRR